MAYEQQTKTNYSSSSKTSSEARNKTKHFKYQSTRVIDRHLDVLGIPKIIGVQPKEVEIKDAYRKICLKTHPDVLGSNHPGRQEAEKKFIEATNSYNFLLKYVRK